MVKAKSKGGAAAASGEQPKFAAGDVVLGKIKGYPPWPGILVDEENVPKQGVLNQRPGKTFLIVRFFPAADYGFNKPHELRRLTKREIEAFLADPHKRNAELRQAYQLAQDPEAWNKEKNDDVRQAEEEGEAEAEEEDMLAEDGAAEAADASKASKKKRKAPEPKKPAAKKQKSDAGKAAKKASASPSTSAAPKKVETAEEPEAEEQELDAEAKKVKGWRHSLQRAFLNKEGVIKADEMPTHDSTLKQVEQYTGITATQLRQTKIGKVMKRIIQLPEIPREAEFNIRQRAQKLCDIWQDVLAGKPREDSASARAEPHANGLNGQTASSEASAPAAPIVQEAPTLSNGNAETHTETEAKAAEGAGSSALGPSLSAPKEPSPAPQKQPSPAPQKPPSPAPVKQPSPALLNEPSPKPVEPAAPSLLQPSETPAPAATQAQEPLPTPVEAQSEDLSKPVAGAPAAAESALGVPPPPSAAEPLAPQEPAPAMPPSVTPSAPFAST